MGSWAKFACLLITAPGLTFAQDAVPPAGGLTELPPIPEGALEEVQAAENESRGFAEQIDVESLFARAPFSSIVVEYQDADAEALMSSTSMAAAARLGASASQVSPNEFEFEISPYATSIAEEGIDPEALMQSRASNLVELLTQDENVEGWYPNYDVTAQGVDPLLERQWHFREFGPMDAGKVPGGTNIELAWMRVTGSSDVVVAVLDTGYLPDHEDTSAANVIDGYDFVSDPASGNDGDGRDADARDPGDACEPWEQDSWHGSHVAGTIGLVGSDNGIGVAGINKSITILPVRVLGKCGGTTRDIVDAIRWSADLFSDAELAELGLPPVPKKADIINLSLGGAGICNETLLELFDQVNASGTLVIVAAGNEADDARFYFPASCVSAVTVAASDFMGNLVTRYSNYGPVVDILAPGGDIQSDLDGDGLADGVLSIVKGDYAYFNGTSMAAPHVSGVAALLLAMEPGLTPDEVKAYLMGYSTPRDSTHCQYACGRGLLNAAFLGP